MKEKNGNRVGNGGKAPESMTCAGKARNGRTREKKKVKLRG